MRPAKHELQNIRGVPLCTDRSGVKTVARKGRISEQTMFYHLFHFLLTTVIYCYILFIVKEIQPWHPLRMPRTAHAG